MEETLYCAFCGVSSLEGGAIQWGVPEGRGQTVNLCDDCYHEHQETQHSQETLAQAA